MTVYNSKNAKKCVGKVNFLCPRIFYQNTYYTPTKS